MLVGLMMSKTKNHLDKIPEMSRELAPLECDKQELRLMGKVFRNAGGTIIILAFLTSL